MLEIVQIALDVISPVFIVIAIFYAVGRVLETDVVALSPLLIYVFIPAVVISSVANAEGDFGDFARMAAMVFISTLILWLIGWQVGRWLKLQPRTLATFTVCVMLINAANYGWPLNEFAFGPRGLELATLYYVANVVISNNMGIYVASSGSRPPLQALMNMLRVPVLPAAVIGFALNLTGTSLPLPINRAVTIMGAAAVPGMLALLGLRLSKVTLGDIRTRLRPVFVASGLRLILGPLIAIPLAYVLGLQGLVYNVAVVESSMPTAVIVSAFAMEFGGDADFASEVILISTVLSLFTLPVLLSFLM